MQENNPDIRMHSFLQGGGEMGELCREYDWSKSVLGAIDEWPQSLCTSVGLVLHSGFPMLLFWGRDSMITFYNDAFRPSLGIDGKHPAIGKPAREMWTDIWDYIGPLLTQVMETGEPVYFEDQLVPFYRNGRIEDIYWTFSYSPAFDDNGEINGVMVICTETTQAVVNSRRLEESEARFRTMAEGSNVLIAVADELSEATYFNNAWVEFTGRPMNELLNYGWADLIHPDDRPSYLQLYLDAFKKKEPFTGEFRILNRNGAYRWLLARGAVRLTTDGRFAGYISSCIDITEQLHQKLMLEESEAHLELLSNTVPAMIFYLDAEQRYRSYNYRFQELYRVNESEAVGKTVREFLGEEAYLRLQPQLERAYRGQQVEFETRSPSRMQGDRWLKIVYTPHKTESGNVLGVIVHATDFTETKKSELALRESESRFRALITEAPVATCLFTGPEFIIALANEALLEIIGKDRSVIGMRLQEAMPWLKGQQFLDIVNTVYTTGQTHVEKAARIVIERNGVSMTRYFDFTLKPLIDENGSVTGIIDMAVDVTEQVLAQQRIEKSQQELLASFNDSPVGLAIVTGDDLRLKMVNPFCAMLIGRPEKSLVGKPLLEAVPELVGQGFDHVLREVMASGKPFTGKEVPLELKRGDQNEVIYIDHTFQPQVDSTGVRTGVLVVAVEVTSQVLARIKIEEKEAALRNAIELAQLGTWTMDVATGTSILSPQHVTMFGLDSEITSASEGLDLISEEDRDMVTKAFYKALQPGSDGRYESEYKVKNRKTGDYLIVRALGQVYYDKLKRPVKISGTAQDVTMQRRAQAALQTEVEKRTKELAAAISTLNSMNQELKRSNTNLEEFAHAASHDLKEPIRKIQFFTNQLKSQLANRLSEVENKSFSRIEKATQRMGNLIDDLLLYSQVSDVALEMEDIDLNLKVQAVLEDLELTILEKNACFKVDALPQIRGYKRQIQQMFQNIFSNALKYSKATVPPIIEISVTPFQKEGKIFHCIQIRDNGIGFEQQYADKIFQMFARLHGKSEYGGTGLGLSIVKKVVENHKGFIEVNSVPDEGSVFNVYLPVTY